MNSQAVQYADASLDMLVLDSYFEPPNLYGHKRIRNSFNEIFSIKLDQITLCFLFELSVTQIDYALILPNQC